MDQVTHRTQDEHPLRPVPLRTYSQLRAALLERYRRPPVHVSGSKLEDHLAEAVFEPLEDLIQRTDRLRQIAQRLVTETALTPGDRARLVSESQDIIERMAADYQQALLRVPTEIVDP